MSRVVHFSRRLLSTELHPRLQQLLSVDSLSLRQRAWGHVRWSSIQCWNCDKEIPLLEKGDVQFLCPCEKKVLLPPTSHNYFDIMGCPVSFRVDVRQLRDRHKQLQRILHPDRFTNKSDTEQGYSVEQSATVNKAFATLLKPYSRGLYMLEQNGLTIGEKDNSHADPELLGKMMDINEEIHEDNPTPQRLKEIRDLNREMLQKCINEVDKCFSEGDYSGAKDGLARMRYVVNIEEELVQILDVE